ncbi:hypothetical protein KAF44_22895 (plasmid) [Cupriavidus necator]|nr:hypothetical protein KAF44_22895 [Cupriavidus necator]
MLAITEQRDRVQAQCDKLAARNTTLSGELELLQQKVAELHQSVAAERVGRVAAEAHAAEWRAEFENTQQLRRQEAELAAQALNGVQQQVEQLMSEQRRLLATADDFKQAALRDRVAREGAEKRVAEVLGRCEALSRWRFGDFRDAGRESTQKAEDGFWVVSVISRQLSKRSARCLR